MTDPKINKRMAELLGLNIWAESQDWITVVNATKNGVIKFNPCENWNQLMPLVVDNKLCLNFEPHDGEYCAESFADSYQHENPQIALCMCLIKVLAAEKEGAE